MKYKINNGLPNIMNVSIVLSPGFWGSLTLMELVGSKNRKNSQIIPKVRIKANKYHFFFGFNNSRKTYTKKKKTIGVMAQIIIKTILSIFLFVNRMIKKSEKIDKKGIPSKIIIIPV